MGFYIETKGPVNKAAELVGLYGAKVVVVPPSRFEDIPSDMALISVVKNPGFEAAGLAYDDKELKRFTYRGDVRPKQWLYLKKEVAYSLARDVVRGMSYEEYLEKEKNDKS